MKDASFKWDVGGLNKVDSKMVEALGKSAYVLQDDVREAQVVPRAVGTLQGEAFYVDTATARQGYVTLGFNTPYARRLYFHPEYHFRTDENPNAQGMWMRHWVVGGKYQNRFSQIFKALLKL